MDKIIDSMENEIEAAITQQQIQTGHDYTNIIQRTLKSIVSMREINSLICFRLPGWSIVNLRETYTSMYNIGFFSKITNPTMILVTNVY